jgi:GTP-binding protein YchF
MAINIGIVGLPNVGKSTLFNALSAAGAEAANFPFCTIEPNVGVVPVPDRRLSSLAELYKSQKIVPTSLEFVDIAGLVKGASKGEGLGNQFLSHIRQVDAIAHVVRCFDDGNSVHVDGSVDPIRDVQTINTELALADLDTADKRLSRTSKMTKQGGKQGDEARAEVARLEPLVAHLNTGAPARAFQTDDEGKRLMRDLFLLTAKPIIYVANLAEGDVTKPETVPYYQKLVELAKAENAPVVPISAAIEAEVSQLPEAERNEYLASMGLTEPGLNKIIREGYKILGLITYLTAGPQETRAWTIREGTKAPGAAGVIHTDFERGFIKAEVMRWEDLVDMKSEANVRSAGKLRVEGKEYVVKDGDVMHFRFNV